MKEFDYTKWDNRPREMWVWNNDENKKEKRFVVYVDSNTIFDKKILALDECKSNCWYEHCAEIEPSRRMTNYELAHWLWEGIQVGEFRECTDYKEGYNSFICSSLSYSREEENLEVSEYTMTRVNGGEWKEPLIEG